MIARKPAQERAHRLLVGIDQACKRAVEPACACSTSVPPVADDQRSHFPSGPAAAAGPPYGRGISAIRIKPTASAPQMIAASAEAVVVSAGLR